MEGQGQGQGRGVGGRARWLASAAVAQQGDFEGSPQAHLHRLQIVERLLGVQALQGGVGVAGAGTAHGCRLQAGKRRAAARQPAGQPGRARQWGARPHLDQPEAEVVDLLGQQPQERPQRKVVEVPAGRAVGAQAAWRRRLAPQAAGSAGRGQLQLRPVIWRRRRAHLNAGTLLPSALGTVNCSTRPTKASAAVRLTPMTGRRRFHTGTCCSFWTLTASSASSSSCGGRRR